VSAAGIGLALLSSGVFAFVLADAPGTMPLRMALRGGDLASIHWDEIAIPLGTLVVCGAVGIAMWRRWRGWRFYAGTVAWLLIAATARALLLQLPPLAARGIADPWYAGAMSLPACIGVVLLAAKRMEPPATPFSPVTPAGVVLILLGIVYALTAWFAPALGWRITFAILCVLFLDTGLRAIFRWRGWHASLGTVAWLMMVFGVVGGLAQLVRALEGTLYWPAAIQDAGTGLFVAALGGFALWARRHERRPG
jgi:hypothetical protein